MPEDNATPPPVPDSLPPVPPAHQAAQTPYATMFLRKPQGPPTDPVWWRQGWIPLAVLAMAAVSADLLWPRIPEGADAEAFPALGLGTGIGAALYLAAIMILRRDLSRGEQVSLVAMGVIGVVALIMSGSTLSWLVLMLAPLILLTCFGTDTELPEMDPKANYRNWWQYWTARRKEAHGQRKWHAVLPTVISVAVGVILFVAFLGIFAASNPVVQLVWDTICKWWNDLLEFLDLDWHFWMHLGRWVLGALLFGCLTLRRWRRAPRPAAAEAAPKPAGTTLLPHLPLMSLIGINLAFLVATSTDIAFLWFGNVPEGISQTAYLHDGAASIIWASILASGILIFLFRRNGTARDTAACRILGHALAAQTFLLALSVYVRLYHQIADYGFTWTRILAGEYLLLGLAGLVILVIYMVRSGKLLRYAKHCFTTMALMVFAFTVFPPGYLAGSLNLAYMDSHPQWHFAASDFDYRVDIADNLAFTCRALDRLRQRHGISRPAASGSRAMEVTQESVDSLELRIRYEAKKAIKRAEPNRWTIWNWQVAQNAAAAREFLATHPGK